MPKFTWPTVVISGGRDLTTPPAVAERIAGLMPGAVLVRLPTTGHSVLDTKERAALRIAAAVSGRPDRHARGAGDGVGRHAEPRRGAADGLGDGGRGPRRGRVRGARRWCPLPDFVEAGYFMKPIAL